jgi:zinc protease
VPKALVMIVFPVPDGMESTRAVRFSFLADVLNDRLRVEVRERLGAAYFPNATLDQSCLYPGVGTLTLRAITDPGAAGTLLEACLAVTDALARDGVTSEEVDRIREPRLEHLRDSDTDNESWLEVLSSRPCGPQESDVADDDEAFYRALVPEPLTELARTYLARERASTLIVHPSAPPEAPR